MANKPFDREVINLRERPLSSDINLAESYRDLALREQISQLFATRSLFFDDRAVPMIGVGSAGFHGSGFKVRAHSPVSMQVTVDAGLGWFNDSMSASDIGGVINVNDQSAFKPLSLTAQQTINVPAADPINPRIDIVEVKFDRRLLDPTSRDILNTGTGAFVAGLVNKTLTYNLDGDTSVNGAGGINYKTGTPAAVPVAPATSVGYVKISQVRVEALAASIAANKIQDLRRLMFLHGQAPLSVKVNVAYAAVTGNTTVTVLNVGAPPGIIVSSQNGASGTFNLVVFAGESSDYATVGGVGNSQSVSGNAYDNGAGQIINVGGGTGASLITASLGDQTAFAANTPSVPVAVGQPYLVFGFQTNNTDGSTGIVIPLATNYDLGFHIVLSR